MTRTLRVLPRAEAELGEAVDWYEARRAGLGVEFLETVHSALLRIQRAPHQLATWTVSKREYRRFVLQRFPYVILFTYDDEDVTIVAVAHARRKPGYWIE